MGDYTKKKHIVSRDLCSLLAVGTGYLALLHCFDGHDSELTALGVRAFSPCDKHLCC